MLSGHSTFIHVGQIHVDISPESISTVLGSCVAVCLYDTSTKIGGMNHYLLPFWNGNGLQSPKYGNISIPKLIEEILENGASLRSLEAKLFGGAAMNEELNDSMMIGKKNIIVAREILQEYHIPIRAEDVGGTHGRKIQLNLQDGKVIMKYAKSTP